VRDRGLAIAGSPGRRGVFRPEFIREGNAAAKFEDAMKGKGPRLIEAVI